jgi:predicted O-methyltransferase YrrM
MRRAVPRPLYDAYKKLAEWPDYLSWRLRGRPMRRIPHLVKKGALQEHARRYGLRVMVETGTNLGQMIAAMLPEMDEIWSIELSEWSYERARRRFARHPQVHMVQGDSAEQMPRVLEKLDKPALFWLDAHNYDITTPIREELTAIAAHPVRGHVILIDDAECFDGRNQYPTRQWVEQFTAGHFPGYKLEEAMHIFRLTPE